MKPRLSSLRNRALPVGAVLVGVASISAIGLGRERIALACLAIAALAVMYVLAPRSIFLIGMVLAVMPQLQAIPTSFAFQGRSIYFTDVLLPLGLLLALRTTQVPPTRRVGFAAALFAASLLIGLVSGVLAHAPSAFILRDLRGPTYILIAYLGTLFLYRDEDAPLVFWLTSAVLWMAALLVLTESATGLQLLGGRVEAIDPTQSPAANAVTRFLVAPVNLATLVLCAGAVLILRAPRFRGMLRPAIALALPSFAIVFLSFSRRALLALLVATVFAALFAPFSRVVARVGVVVVLGLALYAAASSGPLADNSYVATQADAFNSRVVQGVSGSARAQDLGIIWRGREDAFAIASVRRSPVFGHGFGAQYRPSVHGEPFVAAEREYGRTYAHNYYLWLPVKLGLFGLFAFAFFVASPIVAAATRARRTTSQQRLVTFALAAGVLGVVAINVVSPVFNETATAVILGGVLALLRIRANLGSEPDDAQRPLGIESVRPLERAARGRSTY